MKLNAYGQMYELIVKSIIAVTVTSVTEKNGETKCGFRTAEIVF